MKHRLTARDQRALRMIANVLDQQADEEPNLWYRFLKRHAAAKANVISRLPLWLVRRSPQQKE